MPTSAALPADAAQVQRYWQRNHELVRARAHQAARNPLGWGGAG